MKTYGQLYLAALVLVDKKSDVFPTVHHSIELFH
jgi:hypothetical protein